MAASVHNHHFSTTTHSYPLPPLFTPTPTKEDLEDDPPEDSEDDGEEELDYSFDLGVLQKAEKKSAVLDPRDAGTADAWIPRHPSMIRLTGKHPFNSEPPVDLLMRHGFLTPSPIHYVRNHGYVPRAAWPSWTIEVSGLVRRPASLTMDDLVSSFAPLELPVTLVCAGNRRKEQNQVKQTVGFNWGPGGISTAVWRGARLRDILERCGVAWRGIGGRRRALHVWVEGEEDLPGGGGSKYGTSVGLEVAMDPAKDVMVAYMMNGEVLAPDHGFPVRLIIPGYIGGRMVKWLRRIVVAEVESQNYYHFKDNRVLPSNVDAEAADAGGWWYKPEYIINELNINSVITTPCHDEVLPINSVCTQRPYTMKGYAYSGGGRKVTRVEVTLDGGETWLLCDLDHPERPTRHGKYWCWCFWSVDVEVLALLGAKEVAVRAWDQSLNTQPEKLIWNVMGMMNNCWFRVKTNVCRQQNGEIGLVFEHPTQPGNNAGGWIARQKHADSSSDNQALRKISSTPVMTTTTSRYTLSDVAKHSSQSSPWIIIHKNVYDCTTFLGDHPGGADSILINAGTDCTEEFDAIHSDKAKNLLEKYRIGELTTTVATAAPITDESTKKTSGAAASALTNQREKVQCRLVRKTPVSHDVILFRFALPLKDQSLGLPVGKHICLCATIDGKLCMRAYTPTSLIDEVGHFDLVIKIYERGLMTRHLSSLPVDSTVDVKGPIGHIEYAGRGKFLVRGEPKSAKRLAMIAGGTGITPIFQVMQSVLRDDGDDTEMHLVYANRTEDDILLRKELDGWAERWPERVKVWYVVGEVKGEKGWKYSVGLVSEEVLREHVPAWSPAGEVLALACGPPPMLQYAVVPGLEKLGYDVKESLLVF